MDWPAMSNTAITHEHDVIPIKYADRPSVSVELLSYIGMIGYVRIQVRLGTPVPPGGMVYGSTAAQYGVLSSEYLSI